MAEKLIPLENGQVQIDLHGEDLIMTQLLPAALDIAKEKLRKTAAKRSRLLTQRKTLANSPEYNARIREMALPSEIPAARAAEDAVEVEKMAELTAAVPAG